MPEQKARNIISLWQKKWRIKALLSDFLLAAALTILLSTFLHKTVLLPIWISIPLVLVIFLLLVLIRPHRKVTEWDVSRFLNQYYPELQESSHLILEPVESLNLLQNLQAQKVEQVLLEIEEPKPFDQKFKVSVYILLLALVISFVLLKAPLSVNPFFNSARPAAFTPSGSSITPEKILPQISSVSIKIIPPAYTNKRAKEQKKFNLAAQEGAEVVWKLTTNVSVNTMKLLFNDKALTLQPINNEHTIWACRRIFHNSGFYQVAIDTKVSEYYKVEIIKDIPPVIRIQTPAPHTVIDFGRPQKTMINVALSDDYGIQNTSISATISSGSGEAVKFKEKQLLFPDFKAGAANYNLKKLLDLKVLGMQPGDELYFYIRAVDNHNQEKRSDVYIITLPDTSQLMSMEGLISGINVKPEYFRSQRQIIIETQQLVKAKDTISAREFNNRSNNLGIDQKLLRLRYGKFLGEESENDLEGHDDHDEPDHSDKTDFGNGAKIIDEYAHKHDNAEDATFFEPELKAQLKATLSEMWKAELQLRINKPQDALPFEYKALRLLKDLQQKSRAYVAKTGFKATPLKPEKRLTGDLDNISQPVNQKEVEKKKDVYEAGRKAIGLLEMLQTQKELNAASVETLQSATNLLYNNAVKQPSVYLPAVAAMKRLLTAVSNHKQVKATDIALAEKGLQKMLSALPKLPFASSKASYESLSVDYFKNLSKSNSQ